MTTPIEVDHSIRRVNDPSDAVALIAFDGHGIAVDRRNVRQDEGLAVRPNTAEVVFEPILAIEDIAALHLRKDPTPGAHGHFVVNVEEELNHTTHRPFYEHAAVFLRKSPRKRVTPAAPQPPLLVALAGKILAFKLDVDAPGQ